MSDTTLPLLRRGFLAQLASFVGGLGFGRKLLLGLALLATAGGSFGHISGLVSRPDEVQQAEKTIEELNSASRSSALTDDQKSRLKSAESTIDQNLSFLSGKLSPHAWRAGLSFLVAFVVGFAFRQFVKTMATITACVVALVAALTYFDVIDLSNVQLGLEKSAGWVTKVATHAKDLVMNRLPSTVTGFAGFFVGFTRK